MDVTELVARAVRYDAAPTLGARSCPDNAHEVDIVIPDLLRVNWQLFVVINQHASHQSVLDPVMVLAANGLIVVLPLCLLVLWFALARWSPLRQPPGATPRERAGLEYDRAVGQHCALLGGIAVGLALALNAVVAHLVYEPRPFVSHPAVVHQLVQHVADNAFPSDHEAVAMAVASVLVLYLVLILPGTLGLRVAGGRTLQVTVELRRVFLSEVAVVGTLATVAVVVAVLLGVARVYVGVHYPGDIAAGAVSGAFGGLVAVALRPLVAPALRPVIRLAEHLRLA
jgi:undecaprenyl-diphosphatase